MSFAVVLYTHNHIPEVLFRECFDALTDSINWSARETPAPVHRILVCSQPVPRALGWEQIRMEDKRGSYFDCYSKIVAGCSAAKHSQVFLVEHDVLYPRRYFDYVLPEGSVFMFNRNVHRLTRRGWFPCHGQLTSQCCADRELLIEQFKERLFMLERGGRIVWDEPGRNPGDIASMGDWQSRFPAVDVRWGGNLTGDRTARQYSQMLEYWGNAGEWQRRLGLV